MRIHTRVILLCLWLLPILASISLVKATPTRSAKKTDRKSRIVKAKKEKQEKKSGKNKKKAIRDDETVNGTSFEIFPDPFTATIASSLDTAGNHVVFYGEKTNEGIAEEVSHFEVTANGGTTITILLDGSNRPSRFYDVDGNFLDITWESESSGVASFDVLDGINNPITVPFDLGENGGRELQPAESDEIHWNRPILGGAPRKMQVRERVPVFIFVDSCGDGITDLDGAVVQVLFEEFEPGESSTPVQTYTRIAKQIGAGQFETFLYLPDSRIERVITDEDCAAAADLTSNVCTAITWVSLTEFKIASICARAGPASLFCFAALAGIQISCHTWALGAPIPGTPNVLSYLCESEQVTIAIDIDSIALTPVIRMPGFNIQYGDREVTSSLGPIPELSVRFATKPEIFSIASFPESPVAGEEYVVEATLSCANGFTTELRVSGDDGFNDANTCRQTNFFAEEEICYLTVPGARVGVIDKLTISILRTGEQMSIDLNIGPRSDGSPLPESKRILATELPSAAPSVEPTPSGSIDEALHIQIGQDIEGWGSAGSSFGSSVSLSADGMVVAVSSIIDNYVDGSHLGPGQVRVFRYNGESWNQDGSEINVTSTDDSDWPSVIVRITPDARYMVVGVIHNLRYPVDIGFIRIYNKATPDSSWIQVGMDLLGATVGDGFGLSVAISNNGATVAAGASFLENGSVRVFDWQQDSWVQRETLTQSRTFGSSVALSGDGNVLAVGTPGYRSASGRVDMFEWSAMSMSWSRRGFLDAPGHTNSNLGYAVSLSDDGNVVASFSLREGGLGVYKYADAKWEQLGRFVGLPPFSSFSTSYQFELSTDGTTACFGGQRNQDPGVIVVYRFTGGDWVQQGAAFEGKEAGDFFGASCSLSADGRRMAGGRITFTTNNNYPGDVRVYQV